MYPQTVHNLDTLRALLDRLARWDIEVHDRPADDVATMAYSFRDCRLELIRLEFIQLSEEELQRLLQMDYRLQMVVSGHGIPDSIAVEARRALASFGWTDD